ncbi:MAG: Gfo/Idh/MocA family oxidoreductase [Anaerolineae bacterium]
MITFGVVGTAWRAEFFLRVARACPDTFQVVGLVGRDQTRTAQVASRYNVPAFASIEDMVRSGEPQFVVTSVSRGANVDVMKELARLDMPILSETPPAESLDELHAVWEMAQRGARIQVAEQYWMRPHHMAQLAVAHSGKLGRISQAQISVAHGYHGISLMRRFLGVMYEPVTISGFSFTSPIIKGRHRATLPTEEEIITSTQTIARFDFGDRLGIFDFTGDQYYSMIRGQRVLVRGERGELVDETVTYLKDFRTPIRLPFQRHSAGVNANLEGHYVKGIQVGEDWVYTNPLIPAPLPDEDIAVGTCLLKMAEYVAGTGECYSLAEASHDRYLEILMHQAVESGQPVSSETQPWQA